MTRHINLMQPNMLPGHGRVQLPSFVIILSLTLIGCLLFAAYHISIQRALAEDIQQWQARVDTSAERLRNFRQEHPAMANEADLLQENRETTEQLLKRKNALSGLTDQLGEASRGFSNPLASLANYDVEGLWLNRIVLRDSQKHLSLTGFARQPNLIPQYLNQLEGSVFEGLNIQNLSIQQTPSNDSLWRFSIADQLDAAVTLPGEGH